MKNRKLWILVKAERGIPTSLTFLKRRRDAVSAHRTVIKSINPDYDDVQLCEVDITQIESRRKTIVDL
jgi:hypothetical protein